MKRSVFILCLLLAFGSSSFAQKIFRPDMDIKEGESSVVENIYYDYGDWKLRPESKAALDSIVAFLNRNKNITVEISSHFPPKTDYEYSLSLCYKRAQSVVDYLIENDIDYSRLTAKGYGKTTPYIIPVKTKYFKKGTVLTEEFIASLKDENAKAEANKLNQRTQIKILRTDFIPK